MRFDGLEPFREGFPTIQVITPEGRFDLHNDADLRELAVDFQDNELRVAWTLKVSAWSDPNHPEPWHRRTVAGVVLVFSGVRSVVMSGGFLDVPERDDRTIDFLEYTRLEHGLGRIRIVLENDAELVIVASRCRLLTTSRS